MTGNIVSRPYIDLTLHVMRQFGCNIAWTDESTISVAPQAYKDVDYEIENDWSAASYWYEMMALSDDMEGEVTLPDSTTTRTKATLWCANCSKYWE